jgi:hypothetical protein
VASALARARAACVVRLGAQGVTTFGHATGRERRPGVDGDAQALLARPCRFAI